MLEIGRDRDERIVTSFPIRFVSREPDIGH